MKFPKLNPSFLKEPRGVMKFPEIVFGIVCFLLLKFGFIDDLNESELAFITFGSSIVISACCLLVNFLILEEEPKPYLEIALNFVLSILYVTVSAFTLEVSQACKLDEHCFNCTSALGIFSLLNTVAYGFDSFLTAKRVRDLAGDKPIDILQKF